VKQDKAAHYYFGLAAKNSMEPGDRGKPSNIPAISEVDITAVAFFVKGKD